MKFLVKLVIASVLSLLVSTVTTGHVSAPILPIPQNLFIPIVIEPLVRDSFNVALPTGKPKFNQPEAEVKIIEKLQSTSNVLSGSASWYCRAGQSSCVNTYPDLVGIDAYAAAGPKLRAALGESTWRNKVVFVDGIRVILIDWCQCYKNTPNEKLIDLYYDIFNITGGNVKITW